MRNFIINLIAENDIISITSIKFVFHFFGLLDTKAVSPCVSSLDPDSRSSAKGSGILLFSIDL